eukprot:NODE_58_length_28395_cov_1.465720.p7 type:complete len:410 gc:universal NODE_58_length_28395_cov_1.465720:16773-18002(+)
MKPFEYKLVLNLVYDFLEENDIKTIGRSINTYFPERICKTLKIEIESYYTYSGAFRCRIRVNGLYWIKDGYRIKLRDLERYLMTYGQHIKDLYIFNFLRLKENQYMLYDELINEIYILIRSHCSNLKKLTTYPYQRQAIPIINTISSLEFSYDNFRDVVLPLLNCSSLKFYLKDDEDSPEIIFKSIMEKSSFLQKLSISGDDCYLTLVDINCILPIFNILTKVKTLKELDWTLFIQFSRFDEYLHIQEKLLNLQSYILKIERDFEDALEEYIIESCLIPVMSEKLEFDASKITAGAKKSILRYINASEISHLELPYLETFEIYNDISLTSLLYFKCKTGLSSIILPKFKRIAIIEGIFIEEINGCFNGDYVILYLERDTNMTEFKNYSQIGNFKQANRLTKIYGKGALI